MKKNITIIIVGLFLLVSLNAISITGTISKIKMENDEVAFIDQTLAYEIQPTNDYNIIKQFPSELNDCDCNDHESYYPLNTVSKDSLIDESTLKNPSQNDNTYPFSTFILTSNLPEYFNWKDMDCKDFKGDFFSKIYDGENDQVRPPRKTSR